MNIRGVIRRVFFVYLKLSINPVNYLFTPPPCGMMNHIISSTAKITAEVYWDSHNSSCSRPALLMSWLEDGSFKLLSPVGFSVRGLLDQDCLSFKLKEEANSNQPYRDSSFNESLFLKKSQSYIPLIYCLKLQLAKEFYGFQNKHPFENGAPRHSFQTIGTKWSRQALVAPIWKKCHDN